MGRNPAEPLIGFGLLPSSAVIPTMSSPQNLTAVTDIRQGSWGRFNAGMNLKNQPGTWAPPLG